MNSWLVLASLVTIAVAQQAEWAQCGGIGWTGGTTCVSGLVCTILNPYYYQCLPPSSTASVAPTTFTIPPTPTSTPVSVAPTSAPASSAPASSGGATPTISGGFPGSTSTVNSLNQLAKSQGKLYFGSATDNPELTNTPYVDILVGGMFGQMTPGNAMKWGPTEPSVGDFTYTEGDQILDLAQENDMIIRGHNLVWYNQLPSFITSSLSNATLVEYMTQHIQSEVTHYKGQVRSWDVVNEPFSDSGGMRDWVIQETVGTEYINIAFATARENDPNAILYINDYNLEYTGAKFTTATQTVQQLLAEGVPIQGIGFEGHMIVGDVPAAASLAAQMEVFTAMGLEVAITELDIRMTLPETTALLEQQKSDYMNMVAACMMVEQCVGVTLWDYTDLYSWVPSTFSGQGAACPWDDNLARKPAYDGIVMGLMT